MLATIQQSLVSLYGITLAYQVEEFLITDPIVARQYDTSATARQLPEKLLIQEDSDGLNISLYLDRRVLSRLHQDDPYRCLHGGNIREFMIAVEGVSHFVYLAWNAAIDKRISLLELELQAEIDKYILAAELVLEQQQDLPLHSLHDLLFGNAAFDSRLNAEERLRYQAASYYAGKFCHYLQRQSLSPRRSPSAEAELRKLYRLPRVDKIHHIARQRV